jgi:hypothetical protein
MPAIRYKKETFHQVHILDVVSCITCHSKKNAGESTKRLCGIFLRRRPYTLSQRQIHTQLAGSFPMEKIEARQEFLLGVGKRCMENSFCER